MAMSKSSTQRHVAALAFPFSSHPRLLLSLVRRLANAAPDVTFSFYSTAESNKSLFSEPNPPENIKPFHVSDGVPDGYVFSGHPEEKISLFLKIAGESFMGSMQVAEAETGRRITCLMADAFLWFSGDMAEQKGVPWVPFRTGGTCSLSAHFYTDLIRETVGINVDTSRENEVLKFIPGFSELRLGDLPSGIVFGNVESAFSIMLHKMGRALPKAAAVLVNSFEELDPEITKDLKSKLQNFLSVGPSNLTSATVLSDYEDRYRCIEWLDKQKIASVVYVGFGTVATPPPHELAAMAEALEESSTPFLWSLKDNLRKHLPEGFLERTGENGKIVPWAPQVQVLAHSSVGVFITHCGWNSVMESIVAGVPLISRPFFGDQHINTWMVENVWKIGLRVEGGVLTKSGIVNAIELVIKKEGDKLRKQIGSYKELALKALEPKGSSTQNFSTLLELVTGSN